MKISKKIICFILAVIMSVSLCFPTGAVKNSEENLNSPADYKEFIEDEGYDVISSGVIIEVLDKVNSVMCFFAGKKPAERNFRFEYDSLVTEICNYVCETSGFDFMGIFSALPDITLPAAIAVETFNIDTIAMREEMYRRRFECDEQGNRPMAILYYFLGVYFSVIETCDVYGEKTDDPDIYELCLNFNYKDGTTERFGTSILINTRTGECMARDGRGMFSLGFNYNLQDLTLYATTNCWMRDFGFCLFYDIAANSMPAVFKYNTRRFKFDYDGYEWMIQIWKGNYLMTNGGEVGLYCRTPEKFGSFYECASDEQLLPMSMQIYHGDKLLVDMPEQKHWWINGFNMSGTLYSPDSLTMKFTVEMPDEEMLKAFCDAMGKHYMSDVYYNVDGLKVSVVW